MDIPNAMHCAVIIIRATDIYNRPDRWGNLAPRSNQGKLKAYLELMTLIESFHPIGIVPDDWDQPAPFLQALQVELAEFTTNSNMVPL